MLIIDYNQVFISNLMVQLGKSDEVDENLIRHMVLNSLRSYVKKYRNEYGEVIIACDSKRYWRKEVFPFYKASRKKTRDKSNLDWKTIFESLAAIRAELKEHFPYKVIEVDGAEADDIIATLTLSTNEPVMIISSDKDFKQLHVRENVKQFSPILDKYIRAEDPVRYLKEHIITGDRGDGIPNILSPDNCFVAGTRQRPIAKKKLEEWASNDEPQHLFNEEALRGYTRNQALVDLTMVPVEIKEAILNEEKSIEPKRNKSQLMKYFIAKRLSNMMQVLHEF